MKLEIAPVRWGLLIAMCGLLMGVYLGIHFGKDEAEILAHLKAKAEASASLAGDEKAIEGAVESGWKYLKRSHEHFEGLGAIALSVCLLIAALPLKSFPKTVLSMGVSGGAFVYPLFWYLVAFRTAAMGKSAAKESLALMAQSGAGLCMVSFLAVLAAVVVVAIWKNDPPSFLKSIFKSGD